MSIRDPKDLVQLKRGMYAVSGYLVYWCCRNVDVYSWCEI